MALFKVYQGDRSVLDNVPLNDGYAYFCTDTGEFFVDANPGSGLKRIQINANLAKGLTNGQTTINIDDITLNSNIIDIEHGGTGATTAALARTNLGVYNKAETNEIATKSAAARYSLIIPVEAWEGSGPYTYTYSNIELTCGLAGNVPPFIIPEETVDIAEYNKIKKATATAGTGIVFNAEEKPATALSLIIIDHAQGGIPVISNSGDIGTWEIAPNAGAHNAVYRGKLLGNAVTDAQYAAIAAGTFEDLFIGDYWTIGGINYRIAAFDYYLNCGDRPCLRHHAVIVPDTPLYYTEMNETDTTDGGYVGSKMYTEGLEQAKTTIKAAFPGHVLKHRVCLINAVTSGRPSAEAWCDSEVDLMNEQMVYGGPIFMPMPNGEITPINPRVEKSQLPLFTYRPDLISSNQAFWLRDVVNATEFAYVFFNGQAYSYPTGYSRGVRPAFCVF